LLGVLGDKDVAVRVAAAKALAEYHDPEVGSKLADLLADPKLPARLTAAAAFLKSSGTDAHSHTHAPARPVH
jgi:HEAT repeat protein